MDIRAIRLYIVILCYTTLCQTGVICPQCHNQPQCTCTSAHFDVECTCYDVGATTCGPRWSWPPLTNGTTVSCRCGVMRWGLQLCVTTGGWEPICVGLCQVNPLVAGFPRWKFQEIVEQSICKPLSWSLQPNARFAHRDSAKHQTEPDRRMVVVEQTCAKWLA